MGDGESRERRDGANPKLPSNVLSMRFHRARGYSQERSDLAARPPLRDQCQHLTLPWRQVECGPLVSSKGDGGFSGTDGVRKRTCVHDHYIGGSFHRFSEGLSDARRSRDDGDSGIRSERSLELTRKAGARFHQRHPNPSALFFRHRPKAGGPSRSASGRIETRPRMAMREAAVRYGISTLIFVIF